MPFGYTPPAIGRELVERIYELASLPCRRARSGLKMVLRPSGNAVVLWFFEAVD